jgi:hypothetical protein
MLVKEFFMAIDIKIMADAINLQTVFQRTSHGRTAAGGRGHGRIARNRVKR